MRRSLGIVSGIVISTVVLLAALAGAKEAVKKADTVKPPWQRYLSGADAKKVAAQGKLLVDLQEAGEFTEALKVVEVLAELRSKVQGTDHWQTVNARCDVEALRRVLRAKKEEQASYRHVFALRRDAEALVAKGHYRETLPLLAQILAIRRAVLGEEHPHTANSYNNLAYNLHAQGKYKEAEEEFRKALAIYRKSLGEKHPLTATGYNNLAANLDSQGQYKEAEKGHRKALVIRLTVFGEEYPDTANSYNNLASNLNRQGKYREAEEGFRKALFIRRKVLGEHHPDTATSYHNNAFNNKVQGKYRQAEEGYRAALAIRRKMLGEEHPDTANSYNNMAANQKAQGKYAEAEEGFRKALAIRRKVLGEDHPDTARSYNNVATNQKAQGKYAEAEEGFRKALAIRRAVLGEEHPDTATSYNDVALDLNAQGRYAEAEEGFRKALAIYRQALGEEHPHTALAYNNVAFNLNAQGKYREAEEGFRKALAIYRKVLGKEHPDTANSYNNVAANQNAQGKYAEAEENYSKALAIFRKVLGEDHPDTAVNYDNSAFNLNAQGKYQQAEKYWLLGANIFAKARLHIAASGLERAAITGQQSPLPSLAAVLARNGKPDDAWQRFEESLARGVWDDITARLARPTAELDKQIQLGARLNRLNYLLAATLAVKETSTEQSKQREELLTRLRQAQDELADFTRQLEKTYGPIAGQVFARGQIQAALPADAALLAWLDLPGQAKAADPNGEHWAILLRATGEPIWQRLHGSGDKDAWTNADTQQPAQLRAALQSARGEWKPLAERLRKQRLDPLAVHLKGVRHLIVLPSTALAGVPVEVIADKYTISYAHSGTMHAHLRAQPRPSGKGLFALADPIFDPLLAKEKTQPLPPGGVLLTVVVPGSNAANAGLRPNDVLLRYGDIELRSPADLKLQVVSLDLEKRVPVIVWRDGKTIQRRVQPGKLGVVVAKGAAPQALAEQRRLDRLLASRGDGDWKRLPGSRVEVASLHRLFGDESSKQLLDSDASEQRLNEMAKSGELSKYRYVHLATHGEVDNVFPLRSAVILARDNLPNEQQRFDLLTMGQPIPDGRLTAEEVLRRWHLHCDLVTLSACQTALGKYERGEGFVGFAQALILSGSRSVCLSLWKVDDTATALLMERFYQNLLGKRAGLDKPMMKAAALAEAKEWLRKLPREEAVKRAASLSEGVARGKRPALPPLEVAPTAVQAKGARPFAHPYYWAAFVLIGHAE